MQRLQRPLLFLLLLAGGCASDGFVQGQTIGCGPGENVTVEVGLDSPTGRLETSERGMSLLVLVANNGHEEIRVQSVRVQQMTDIGGDQPLEISPASGRFDQAIAGGDDYTFELPATVRLTGRRSSTVTSAVALDVSVGLSNGDVYRCRFSLPV